MKYVMVVVMIRRRMTFPFNCDLPLEPPGRKHDPANERENTANKSDDVADFNEEVPRTPWFQEGLSRKVDSCWPIVKTFLRFSFQNKARGFDYLVAEKATRNGEQREQNGPPGHQSTIHKQRMLHATKTPRRPTALAGVLHGAPSMHR